MAGLQGAGKTTTAAKLAGKIKSKGKKPLLVACDVYRPAAITQLQVNGEKQGVEVFTMGDKQSPVDIAKAAVAHAKANQQNVVIIDTAGRLHVDEDMMQELADIKDNVDVDADSPCSRCHDRTGCSQCSPDFCREGWNRWSDPDQDGW
ncbi:MAG: zeta toxin family protein [Ruminococcus sp.]